MIVTLRYIADKFRHYNDTLFHGALEPPMFALSRARTSLGLCTYKRNRKADRLTTRGTLTLKLSVAFDLPEEEWDDVLIHEMIHCYIAQKGLKDTSAHGVLFRRFMDEFNTQYARHIRISRRAETNRIMPSPQQARGPFVVALVRFADGRGGIKVLPRIRQRIEHYCRSVLRDVRVKVVRVFVTNDEFFRAYPKSSALRVYYIEEGLLRAHLGEAVLVAEHGCGNKGKSRLF